MRASAPRACPSSRDPTFSTRWPPTSTRSATWARKPTRDSLYLVAISRKLPDPLSAVILSQSGAGKSGLTEVIERLTPPEDVVLLTRLTPQSLYYTAPGFLDQKLVIVEERNGSVEADYSIRVLQSRKKLIAAVPVKDPATGSMRTKVFTVEARAAFIEATTAGSLNHENATRCFELTMDESVAQTRRIHERQRLAAHRARPGAARARGRDRASPLERAAAPRARPRGHPLRGSADLPHGMDAHAARPRALPEPHRSLGLPAPAPARARAAARSWPASRITRWPTTWPATSLPETLSDIKKPLREAFGQVRESFP